MAIHSRRRPDAPTASSDIASRVVEFITGRRTKWVILAIWIALIAAAAPLAERLSGIEENDAAAFLPRTAESTEVVALLPRFFGAETIPAVVVYSRPDGITDADRELVESHRTALASLVPGGAISPLDTSADGRGLMFVVPLRFDVTNEDLIFDQIDEIRATVSASETDALSGSVTGPAGGLVDSVEVFQTIDTALLLVTLIVVAVLLLIIYRSPVLWLLPLLCVALASQFASGIVYLIANNTGVQVNGLSSGILPILVLGAGTDYALLLLARYREELRRHEDRHVAMAIALRRAGPAILASGGTVVVGVLCLLIAELNSNRSIGPIAAVGIIAALLAVITLLPALLVIVGRWPFWPFIPRVGDTTREGTGPWGRVAHVVGRGPRRAWVSVAVLLLALGFGALSMETGLTDEQQFTTTPDSVIGQRLLEAHFPAGAASPAYVIAHADTETAVTDAVLATEGVSGVQPALAADNLVLIPAILTDAPTSSAAADTVDRLRTTVGSIPTANAIVGGDTATALDSQRSARNDELLIMPLVLLVIFAILVLLLRAVVAPFVLVATVALSFLASVGGAMALFYVIFGYTTVDYSLLLLGFVFSVALGIDYNIFLITRVREEVATLGHRQGVLRALSVTGGVISSAGIVLAATFAVLGVFPIVGLAQLGILVSFGVLLDTFIVRSILVPALALEIGPRFWWPSRLVEVARQAEADSDAESREADPHAPAVQAVSGK